MSDPLTNRMVEAAKAPASGQRFVRDPKTPGLALRVTAGGAKAFVFEGRIKGRVRRVTLGAYPDLSVAAARDRVTELRAAVIRGENPADERRDTFRQSTFKELAQRFLEQHSKPRKRSWKEDERRLKQHLAAWNTRRVEDIALPDVLQVQRNVASASGPYESNRTMALVRVIFRKARIWGVIASNPAEGIELYPEKKRERFLSPAEMRRVLTAIQNESDIAWRTFFVLSLLLGTRRTELLSARWDQIDLEEQTLALPETKSGQPHLLPLPAAAVSLLEQLPSRVTSDFVFAGRLEGSHLAEPKKAWQRIRTAAKVPDVRVHDLRRTLGSWLAGSGHNLSLIGRVLNHKNVSTTAIYARMHLDPLREALEANATKMLATIAPDDTSGQGGRDTLDALDRAEAAS